MEYVAESNDMVGTAHGNNVNYKIAVVELCAGSTPKGMFSILLTIGGSINAMPVDIDADSMAARLWQSSLAADNVAAIAQQQILEASKDPISTLTGSVAACKVNNKHMGYIGYVDICPEMSDTHWCEIDQATQTIVVCRTVKEAQARAAELMDVISAFNIDWTKMPITDERLG